VLGLEYVLSTALIEKIRKLVTPSHVWAVISASFDSYIQKGKTNDVDNTVALREAGGVLAPLLTSLGWGDKTLGIVLVILSEFKDHDIPSRILERNKCRMGACPQDAQHRAHLRATERFMLDGQFTNWKVDIRQVGSTLVSPVCT
jgi:hypothetical protein